LAVASHADLLVDFSLNNNWVAANANNYGLSGGVVPFATTNLSPAAFTGPAFFGGAGGTVPLSSWMTQNSTPDYLNAAGSTTAAGQKVWALYMFNNQSATITQVVYDIRLGGTAANQTNNNARIVVRKTDGSYYISESKLRLTTGYFTNSSPGTLAWYNYVPSTSLTGIGSQVSGFELNNVNGIGELVTVENTSGVAFTIGAGTRTFQAWGVIPEPATIGMLGLGALVTLLIRRVKS
jgi:hypothetical protein